MYAFFFSKKCYQTQNKTHDRINTFIIAPTQNLKYSKDKTEVSI